jgi:4-amino-4-deoxy-L-arabinose transferase-like glycosyltransferase
MLAGAGVLAALGATGLFLGAAMRAPSVPDLLLAAYVLAFSEVVGLCLLLSAFDSLTRGSLIASTLVLAVAAGALWVLARAPRVAVPDRRSAAQTWRSSPLRVLTVAVGGALAYVVALTAATAPNGWDPLNYHLARAAFWLQSEHVGYIRDAYDERLNFNPPNGEIGLSFALGVTHNESAAPFVQFFSALACSLAIYALARRFGRNRAEALFGALLFLALPIVLLQSAGAKNDLIVASFVLAACVFVLEASRRSLVLTALATALAVGTKFTAAYGLPILLILALCAPQRSWRIRRVISLTAGAAAGAYWYIVNAFETGHLLGDQSNVGTLTAPLHVRENVLEAYGLGVDTFDLSGAQGLDLLLYVVAAVALALGLAFRMRRSGPPLVAAALVCSPLLLLVISTEVGRPTLVHLYEALDKPAGYIAIGDAVWSSPRTASDTGSWFGPLGVLLVVGVGIVALSLARRGSLPRIAAVGAAAPIIWFVPVALTLTYHPWQGRFFIVAVGLSASLWGLALRRPAIAWSAVAIAVVTAVLSLDHFVEKPGGLRLFDRMAARSVWQWPRWEVQSQHDPELAPVYRFVEQSVPERDAVALALGPNEFAFPFFGPHLARQVVLVPSGSNGDDAAARWLFANTERRAAIDTSCWHAVLRSDRGTVFRRGEACGSG